MTHILLVGAGGFLGAVARYLLGGWVYRVLPFAGFPYGTLAVNLLGCLLIGFLSGLAEARQVLGPEARMFLLIGFLGSFTTFSTFGYETMALARDAEYAGALANIGVHVAAGLVAVWAGGVLSRFL